MKILILFIATFFMQIQAIVLIPKKALKWRIVNDTVMGGVSQSNVRCYEKKVVFSGNVSTKNNGGFAMLKAPVSIKNVDNYAKIILNIKGDGKRYQFRIKSSKNDYVSYVQYFQSSGKKQVISLNLNKFYPSFRGRKLNHKNFNQNTIEEIAILIGNKKNQSFKLEIEKITLQ